MNFNTKIKIGTQEIYEKGTQEINSIERGTDR